MIHSIELFSGTGGLALGLQKAGINHKALFEWDKYSCDNIQNNILHGYKYVTDWNISNVDVRTVDYSEYINTIDVVSGGPPCQPFSMGGKANAYNDNRDMWPEAIRAVRELQPKAFVFENVKGLMRTSLKDYFQYIILQLQYPSVIRKEVNWQQHYNRLRKIVNSKKQEQEYDISYQLVNAADYGIPQSRFRVIIVGFRKDLNVSYSFPIPEYSREALLYDKWVSGEYWKEHRLVKPQCNISASRLKFLINCPPTTKRWRTVRDAIGDLPTPQINGSSKVFNHELHLGAKSYAGHSGSSLDEPSKTIKAGVHGVPGGENTVNLDDGTVRYYTVRESARIQTFDDDYRFDCPWGEAMRQIGNAVPVRLAEIIGLSVVKELERRL